MRRTSLGPLTIAILLFAPSCSGGADDADDAGSDPSAVVDADSTPGAEDTGPWGALIADLQGEEPSPQQALDWFVSLSGAEIPGASAVYGRVEGPVSFTHVLEWLEHDWEQFSTEQQVALQTTLALVDPQAAGAGAAVRRPLAEPQWLRDLVVDTNRQVGTLLGHTIDAANIVTAEINDGSLGTGLAEARGNPSHLFGVRVSSECLIVYGGGFLAASRAHQLSALAHEITHCHQHDASTFATAEAHSSIAKWYQEGSAGWVGEVVSRNSGFPMARSWWSVYFRGDAVTPAGLWGYALAADSTGYSSIGAFQWAAERMGEQELARGILTHMNESTEDKLDWLFGDAGTPSRERLAAQWAAQASRRSGWGANWYMAGLGLAAHGLASSGRSPNELQLRPGVELTGAGNVGTQLAAITITIVPTAGVDLISLGATGWSVVTAEGRGEKFSTGARLGQVFCVGAACSCRAARSEGPPIEIEPGTKVVLAMASDVGVAARWSVKGYDLPDDGSDCDPCPAAGPARRSPAGAAPPDPVCGGNTESTSVPTTVDEGGCLVGSWLVDNTVMGAAFLRAVSTPGGGAPPSNFTDAQVTGTWTLLIGADGSLVMTASGWTLSGTATGPPGLGSTEEVEFNIAITFNGTVSAGWSASASRLTITGASGLLAAKATATVYGQQFDVTGPSLSNLPLASNSTSSYTCDGGVLVITATASNAIPLTFNRVG
jgi:hypothetical protein